MIATLTRDDAGLVRPLGRHDLPVVAAMAARLAGHEDEGKTCPLDVVGLHTALFGTDVALHGLVVERFEHVVGYALAKHEGGEAELAHLFVHPGSRGLGLGRMLVDAAIRHARAAGYPTLRVGDQAAGETARAFYEACDFQTLSLPRG